MAGIGKRGDWWWVRFRYAGKFYNRSLGTQSEPDALALKGRVEATLLALKRGIVRVPEGLDAVDFILAGGQQVQVEAPPKRATLSELIARYQAALPPAAKAPTTMLTEGIHLAHIGRLLGENVAVASLGLEQLQRYVNARAKERYHGRTTSPETIDKELGTFAVIWDWGTRAGITKGPSPSRGVTYPKRAAKAPFRSLADVEATIARGHMSANAQADLWECLVLTPAETTGLLEHVRTHCRHRWVYVFASLAAWTGMRRSEILRSQVEDVDLATGFIVVREKKRVQSRSLSYRHVPLHQRLREVLTDWLGNHHGGPWMVCCDGRQIDRNQAARGFRAALAGTAWANVRGYHVLRHSFASNLAASGKVDQGIIDRWMGHQTEEMRARYRHLFPSDQQRAISMLSPTALDTVLGDGQDQRQQP